jgi:hypothetical protein
MKSFGDIGTMIHILRTPEQYLLDLMRIKPFSHQIWVRKVIPGIGEDGVQSNLSSNSMIPMPNIAPVRVSSYHGLGPI